MAPHAKALGLYADAGASRACVVALESTFNRLWPHRRVVLLDAQALRAPTLAQNFSLVCLPGGRDMGYLRLLGRAASHNLMRFVQRGGRYLGSCAGAYFAARTIAFAPGTELEVSGPRPLGFWRGRAVGPVGPQGFAYRSERGACAMQLAGSPAPGTQVYPHPLSNIFVYTNGGCAFEPGQRPQQEHVWARYTDGRRAAVGMRRGRGKVLLWGLHPELQFDPVNPSFTRPDEQKKRASTLALAHHLFAVSLRWLVH